MGFKAVVVLATGYLLRAKLCGRKFWSDDVVVGHR
jgi:hypothetical protein